MKPEDLQIVGEINFSELGRDLLEHDFKRLSEGEIVVVEEVSIRKNHFPYIYMLRNDGGFSFNGIFNNWAGSFNHENWFKVTKFLKVII